MFTNTALGVVSFSVVIVGPDPESSLAFFEDLTVRVGRPEVHQLPGASNFGYDAPDPVRAGNHRARFECYVLFDTSEGCVGTLVKSDAIVVMEGAAEKLALLVRKSARLPAELCIVVAGPPSALDPSALPGAWVVALEGSSFEVFKAVAKVVLTAHKRGQLREHNPLAPRTPG